MPCATSKLKITKTAYKVEPLIGVPYGSVFEVRNRALVRVDGKLDQGLDLAALKARSGADEGDGEEGVPDADDAAVAGADASGADTAEAVEGAAAGTSSGGGDDVSAKGADGKPSGKASCQALSAEHITEMKAGGSSGHDIVAALIENSATFASKTEFAQQKYLKKKTLQYVPGVDVNVW